MALEEWRPGMAERRQCCKEKQRQIRRKPTGWAYNGAVFENKRESAAECLGGAVQLSPRALTGLVHFPGGMVRAQILLSVANSRASSAS
jgi:hypothetical protein